MDLDDPKVAAGWYRHQYADVLAEPDDQINRLLAYAMLDLAGDTQAQAALFAELQVWIDDITEA